MCESQNTNRGLERMRGFALPSALILLVVAMMSCGAFLSVAYHEYNLSVQEEQHAQALFLAQAGLQRTLNLASNTPFDKMSAQPFTAEPLGAGTYTVEVSSPDDELIIVSTGNVSDRSRTIRQTIIRD